MGDPKAACRKRRARSAGRLLRCRGGRRHSAALEEEPMSLSLEGREPGVLTVRVHVVISYASTYCTV